jgi:membrane associated rhomboid family serine protease
MLISVTTMSGMTPNMDLYGHFGGALGGFLMAILMADMKPEHRPKWYDLAKVLAALGLAGVLGGSKEEI